MLPEHQQTVTSIDGIVRPQIIGVDNFSNNGNCDNIITISTSNIDECHSININDSPQKQSSESKQQKQQEEDKHQKNLRQHKIVQFLSKRTAPEPNHSETTSNATNAINIETISTTTTTIVKANENCCNISQCISFQDNIADVHHRKGRRLNGLQLPLHPLQIFGWLVLILFAIASYWLLIPSFAYELQGPLYGLITGLYVVHIVSHLTALLLDPADRELRRVHRNDRIVPEFDRSKHTHVIENGRCHLCNIRTSSQRTKHCSVCNKCVGKFDHHCKWLNHCIGSRNYVAFLMCVVSAVIATLVIVAAVIAQIVLYYVQPDWLNFWYSNNVAERVVIDASSHFNESTAIDGNITNITNAVSDGNITFGIGDTIGNLTNATVFLLDDELYLENGTVSSLAINITNLIGNNVNSSFNASLLDSINKTIIAGQNNNTTITAAAKESEAGAFNGIGVNDTIFLICIGILGLLAAITAGLLLHLCFFHIYISFLGLTTYEYIRNHRQAQDAKAKNSISTLPKINDKNNSDENKHPSKKTNNCGQIYICSSLKHPNYFENHNNKLSSRWDEHRNAMESDGHQATTTNRLMHCCANSREYHQTALKTYYMCSLLEEDAVTSALDPARALGIAHISGRNSTALGDDLYSNDSETDSSETANLKTFHCCSTFAATTTQRRVSAATNKATLVNDLEAAAAASLSARRSYMKFTEQCTFCTFRLRSPIIAKRNTSARSTASAITNRTDGGNSAKSIGRSGGNSHANIGSVEHQRCCMKAISKHQRWRRKWNCCSSVPDSPDVPNDIIAALAMRHQHQSNAVEKVNATEIPVHFIKTINGNGNGNGNGNSNENGVTGYGSRPPSPRNPSQLKMQARAQNTHTWPVARLRHMVRMLNRYRRQRCRHHPTSPVDQIKQNQIRPLQFQSHTNGCHQHYFNQHTQSPRHQQQQQHQHRQHQKVRKSSPCSSNNSSTSSYYGASPCYDSSSPQPPSSTTPTDTDASLYSDASTSVLTTPSSSAAATPGSAIETILPTSVIRDDTSITYTAPMGMTLLPPALPPPTRRKIPNPTDLDELVETLGFIASHPSNSNNYNNNNNNSNSGSCSTTVTLSPAQRLPALSTIYRRQRRKHLLRTRSPTLSPIHESGLSNPTSPQPCRHNSNINFSMQANSSGNCSGNNYNNINNNINNNNININSIDNVMDNNGNDNINESNMATSTIPTTTTTNSTGIL